MEKIKIINCVIMAVFFACYAYQFFYIPVAWLKKPKPLQEGSLHRYAVLIAARNEETVIADLIHSLKRQEYPAELIDIYVVADNCNDNTVQIAESCGAIVFERFDSIRVGKGYALNFLLGRIEEKYDAYLVFDADNVVDLHYIREIDKVFSAGYDMLPDTATPKTTGIIGSPPDTVCGSCVSLSI